MDLEEICYVLDIVCFADLNHGLSKESELSNCYLRYLVGLTAFIAKNLYCFTLRITEATLLNKANKKTIG